MKIFDGKNYNSGNNSISVRSQEWLIDVPGFTGPLPFPTSEFEN